MLGVPPTGPQTRQRESDFGLQMASDACVVWYLGDERVVLWPGAHVR